uniref:SH3 domain-containing protein n=1 Tax=Sinocyclocheilus rhinocerous TaxID=307959 RepID=A0A673L0C5_9TELE
MPSFDTCQASKITHSQSLMLRGLFTSYGVEHLSKSDANRCILYSVLHLFQLQRLKRSLSFKTKSLRSKSADNFFQRPIEDVKFQTELLSDVSSSTGHLSTIAPRPADPNAHTFLEHIFKKPHFCDVCNHMIVACGSKVDPVYETLRFGTSLAQKTKRTSGVHYFLSTQDVPEEKTAHSSRAQLTRKPSDNELKRDPLQLNTYVALFEFTPQDNQDLEMRPGDRIILADDSNDDWWKGVIEDRIGYFPASFAHQVRAGDRVFRCNRTFIGSKEQGQITLKEGQICVSGEDDHNGFIRVASGKKRGFVPCDVLENI